MTSTKSPDGGFGPCMDAVINQQVIHEKEEKVLQKFQEKQAYDFRKNQEMELKGFKKEQKQQSMEFQTNQAKDWNNLKERHNQDTDTESADPVSSSSITST